MNKDLPEGIKKLVRNQASRSVLFLTKFAEYVEPKAKTAVLTDAQKRRLEVFHSYVLFFRDRLIKVYFPEEKEILGSISPYLFDQKFQKSLKTDIAHQIVTDRFDLKRRVDTPDEFVQECIDIINLLNNPKRHEKNDIPDGDVWITKGLDGRYCFDGEPIKGLTKGSLYMKIFELVFDELGKMGGAISYSRIIALASGKIPSLHTTKDRTNAKIANSIRSALTGSKNGFLRAAKSIPRKRHGILQAQKNSGIILFSNKR